MWAHRRFVFDKIFWLKITVSIGLLASFLLSSKLWTSARFYPLTPVWAFLKPLPFPFDYIFFFTLLALLVLIAVAARPVKLIAGFILLALVYASFDQSRWQPWFYQYLCMLAALGMAFTNATNEERDNSALPTCRLIIAGIYFWSAIQKVNAAFVRETFPWIMDPILSWLPRLRPLIDPIGFAVPILELGIAVGLLTKKFRNAAVIAAWSMHLIILASIGPWGHNHNNVIWPWNLAMCVFVYLLFWRENNARIGQVLWGNKTVFHFAVFLLFGIAPALNMFHDWDSYLSFDLYSGNYNDAAIYVTNAVAERLPAGVRKYLTDVGQQMDELYLCDWSWGELNVPPYPEIRVYKNVGEKICSSAPSPSDVVLVVQEKTTLFRHGEQHTYDCASLSHLSP